MKEIILYYTIGGTSRKYAEKLSEEIGADIAEVKEKKDRGMFAACIPGIFQAMAQKSSDILELEISLDDYDKITLVTPIWAGKQAPAMNSVAALIPKGKEVTVVVVSGQGKDYGEALAEKVKNFGGIVKEVINVESNSLK